MQFPFESIDQLDELTHAMGWHTEYRQLQPGSFSSVFTTLEGESWFLMEEQSSRTVEIQAPAPEDMYALALPAGGQGVINGQALTDSHVVVMGPDSDTRATLTGGMKVPQIGIPVERFESMVQAVAPNLVVPRAVTLSLATTPDSAEKLRQTIRSALFTPSKREAIREEAISRILADFVAVLAYRSKRPDGRSLHRAAAKRALNRAREYIEANLGRTIRVSTLCQYAGTSLSTLERSFVREMGMSPQQYVKVRRLNAVRSCLKVADKEQRLGVTETALSYGFAHLGRFAGEYYRHFGEYPRDTLNSN